MNQQSSKSAMAALIISIVALVLSAIPIINNFAFVLAAVGILIGIVGVAKKSGVGRGKAIVAIVISILAGAIVFASQSFYSSAIDAASSEVKKSTDKVTGDATEELLKNDVTVELGKFVASQDEYGLVTSELPVTVTNKNAEKKSYSIQLEAIDANGQRVGDEYVTANDLGAGQTQSFKAFAFITSDKVEAMKAATFKIVSVSQY